MPLYGYHFNYSIYGTAISAKNQKEAKKKLLEENPGFIFGKDIHFHGRKYY